MRRRSNSGGHLITSSACVPASEPTQPRPTQINELKKKEEAVYLGLIKFSNNQVLWSSVFVSKIRVNSMKRLVISGYKTS